MRTGDDVKITNFTVVEKSDEEETAENAEIIGTTDESADSPESDVSESTENE